MCELLNVFNARMNLERTSTFSVSLATTDLQHSAVPKVAVEDRQTFIPGFPGAHPLRHLKDKGNLQQSPRNHLVR